MSDVRIVVPSDVDELKAFVPTHRRTYLMSAEDADRWTERLPPENFRIAERNGKPIGGMALLAMGQWFGGRPVPMTGISSVGIDPQARAGGAGTAFMRTVLEELHASGVPLSSLYPATQTIYRRCGYELAGDYIEYRLDTDDSNVRDRSLDIELTSDRAAIVGLYNHRARRTAGVLDRSAHVWRRVLDGFKPDAEADWYLVTGPNGPEGYVTYRRQPGKQIRAHMHGDVVALTGAAARRILAFIADHRSFVETFDWIGAPADPLTFQLGEPRRRVELSWPWMLRIVDVRSALRERGYPPLVDAELHLRVSDDILTANNGDYVVRVAGGKADVEAGGDGRIAIDIRGLATLYSGYMSAFELLATGYVEAPDRDLQTASTVFAGPAPWLADFF